MNWLLQIINIIVWVIHSLRGFFIAIAVLSFAALCYCWIVIGIMFDTGITTDEEEKKYNKHCIYSFRLLTTILFCFFMIFYPF